MTPAADLIEFVRGLGSPRVLVVGDLMLDRYVWGDAERISQEAPVALLRADRREDRLGGASSVATLLRALDARVTLAGVIGHDDAGRRVRDVLGELGVAQDAVVTDENRPTTVKERYIGRAQARHPQQMLRVDFEDRSAVTGRVFDELAAAAVAEVAKADVVLISDYDKGVCTPALLRAVVAAARRLGKRVVADPARSADYRKYHGCSAVTPNRLEAGLATGRTVTTTEDAFTAADGLRAQLGLEAAVVTLDKDGMALSRDGSRELFPTRPRQVYDITGAGDMVMAVLGVALAAGADYPTALRLANVAGGLEVERVGVATVTRAEILRDIADHAGPDGKGYTVEKLLAELDRQRAAGRRVAFTNGCFDILHAGHVQYLADARAQADYLVVGLNSDDSVRRLKGADRPVNAEDDRAAVLAGLASVDAVVVFDESTPERLIRQVRPDVLVKGSDYRKSEVVGAAFVESYGGRVHLAPLREGRSTTNILAQLKAA